MDIKKIFSLALLPILFCMSGRNNTANAQTTPDPGTVGTHTVLKQEYNLGDFAYTAPSTVFPVPMEVRGSVHYPSDLASGPFPVLLWLHGRHNTCYDPITFAASSSWPCPSGTVPIPSYAGYDYAARVLASHGYIVISVSANAINANDGGWADEGMSARAYLVQHHLDLWKTWNTTGGTPFGTTFVGKLDMKNIGTMGHSRGGEGVIFQAEYNKSLGSPYGIKAILTLAPVDFYRHVVNGIPLMDVAPYCDGDVSDMEGVHFYDDARYKVVTDETPKHTVLMMGANHNHFNTVWSPGFLGGGEDDWDYVGAPSDPQCGPASAKRFDTTKQKNAYVAYASAFYRLYLGHETQFAPILETRDIVPPASSTLSTSDVYVSYHPGQSDRLDINRIDTPNKLTINSLRGTVTQSGLVTPTVCGNTAVGGESDCGIGSGSEEPHFDGLSEMKIEWNDTSAYYQNQIPAANQNLGLYKRLQFRTCVDFMSSTPATAQDFSVQLIGVAGDTGSVAVSKFSHVLFFQPGTAAGDLPKSMVNTVSIPIDTFKGVNLAKVAYVRFKFNKVAKGAIAVTDLALTSPVCGNFGASFKDSIGHGYVVVFTNKSTYTAGDTISYLWSFGNPASGTRDTSTQVNPVHRYTGKGTYTACLYAKVKRANGSGLVCTDTICTTFTLVTSSVPQVEGRDISIIPNPARDYLQITGAESTDVLRLIDLYGRVVLTVPLNETTVRLPQTLSAGVYTAVVTTSNGNLYQKIVVNR